VVASLTEWEIRALPKKPTGAEFGLSEAQEEKISSTDPKGNGWVLFWPGYRKARIIGALIAWSVWAYCCFMWWQLPVGVFFAFSIFAGMPLTFLGTELGRKISQKLRWGQIPDRDIAAYRAHERASAEAKNAYIEAYNKLGIDIEGTAIRDYPGSDDISRKWSRMFHDPQVSSADFIRADKLPEPRQKVENYFRHEIFTEYWASANTPYLAVLETNLVMNLPRFVDIRDDYLSDPVIAFGNSVAEAEKKGIPVDQNEIASKMVEIANSADQERYRSFVTQREALSVEYLEWIRTLKLLVDKTKEFDRHFFYVPKRK
jgi:hypothetical protein